MNTNKPAWHNYFLIPISPGTATLLAVIVSLLLIYYLFPLSFLKGHGTFFQIPDPSQHVSGWWLFMQDSWRFPLLMTKRLNYPEGASIILTDSLPLAALILKIFRNHLPANFNYFGWWQVIKYLSQALAAVFIMRTLGIRNLLPTFIMIVFVLIVPAFSLRYPHIALGTHSTILFALGLYIGGIKNKYSFFNTTLAFITLTIVALLIHPYLFPMVYLFYIAFLIDTFYRHRKTLRSVIQAFLICLVIIFFAFLVFGYFGLGGEHGFSIYGLNLLSPFCGNIIPCPHPFNFESFNYLGVGVILLLCIVLIRQWPWLVHLPRQYPGIAIVCLVFLLFSISNRIHVARSTITIPLPHFITSFAEIFRVSGRFFWPLGYLLIIIALLGVMREKNLKFVTGLLLFALIIQGLDTLDFLKKMKEEIQASISTNLFKPTTLFDNIIAIDIYPRYVPEYHGQNQLTYATIQYLAASNHLLFNTAKLAHPPKTLSKIPLKDIQPVEGHLYLIIANAPTDLIPESILKLAQSGKCDSSQWINQAGFPQEIQYVCTAPNDKPSSFMLK